MKKAIFLDRDGVLNVDKNYVYNIDDLEIFDGNIEVLSQFKELGYLLIVITNQSGIGRGYYTLEDCSIFNRELEKISKIKFDHIYICPHLKEDKCKCRKPKNENLLKANKKFGIDFKNSYFVGDKESDIKCGESVGIKTVFIDSGRYNKDVKCDFKVKNLFEFYNILKNDL